MDNGNDMATLDRLAEEKEREWKSLQSLRMSALCKDLEEKEKLLQLERTRFGKLKEDFEYNLKIIEKRDAELFQYEKLMHNFKEKEIMRNCEVSDVKIKLEEFTIKLEQAEKEKIELQNHYAYRISEMQGQMKDFMMRKGEEFKKEKEDFVVFKRNAERQLQDAGNEMESQKRQLIFEFDEQQRKKDSEHKMSLDELHNAIHGKEVHLRMLKRELEISRENMNKKMEEKTDVDEQIVELNRKLNLKSWEMKDVENITAIKLAELKQKCEGLEKEKVVLNLEFQKKYAEMDKKLNIKENQLKSLKESSQEHETEMQGTIDTLKSQIVEEEHKLKQTIWDFNDRMKERDLIIQNQQGIVTEIESKFKNEQSNLTKSLVARDVEIENLKSFYDNVRAELDRVKAGAMKMKSELKLSLDREKILEQAKVQHELDWQRRFDDISSSSEEKFKNLIQKLESKLKSCSDNCEEKQRELDQREHLLQVFRRDKDIAYSLLKKNGIEIAAFVNDVNEMIPKSELLNSLNENEDLRNVIRHMRHEIEAIVTRHKQDSKLASVEYAKDLESQVQELKQEKRKLICSVEDMQGKMRKLQSEMVQTGNNTMKWMTSDLTDVSLKAKLKSAVLKIQSLSNEKDQLISLGNRLRAEIADLKMQLKDKDLKEEDRGMNGGAERKNLMLEVESKHRSNLDRLEEMQYRLMMERMKENAAIEDIKVKMSSTSEDASEQSIRLRENENFQTNDSENAGKSSAVPFAGSGEIKSDFKGTNRGDGRALNVTSSSDLSSLHELWKLLDETESVVSATPRTSSRRAKQQTNPDVDVGSIDLPERDENVPHKQVDNVEIAGHKLVLVGKQGPTQPLLSKKAKGVYASSKKKPSVQLPEAKIRRLCQLSRDLFIKEKTLIEVSAPVNICGDIHGQFGDLLRHFNDAGYPGDYNYLFLGDYVDRGKRSLETICLLLAYKVKFPQNIHLLRGNHECASINRIYGFYDECKRRYNIKLWKIFTDCFNCLPLVAIVESTIFCVHGGLSPDLNHLDQIRILDRPMDIPDTGLAADLLWSDPDEDITGWGDNDRGVSWTFGGDVVSTFLKQHDLSLIARAHQVVEDGYQFFQKRKLVTLFSAPNYCGEFDNAAALMKVSESLLCSFNILKPNLKRRVEVKESGKKSSLFKPK
eukprot:gene8981-9939_t